MAPLHLSVKAVLTRDAEDSDEEAPVASAPKLR